MTCIFDTPGYALDIYRTGSREFSISPRSCLVEDSFDQMTAVAMVFLQSRNLHIQTSPCNLSGVQPLLELAHTGRLLVLDEIQVSSIMIYLFGAPVQSFSSVLLERCPCRQSYVFLPTCYEPIPQGYFTWTISMKLGRIKRQC